MSKEIEANIGENLTAAEIEKELYRLYQRKGLIWTPLSFWENIDEFS